MASAAGSAQKPIEGNASGTTKSAIVAARSPCLPSNAMASNGGDNSGEIRRSVDRRPMGGSKPRTVLAG